MVDNAVDSSLDGVSVLEERERQECLWTVPPGEGDHEWTRALVIVAISFIAESE
jgi:hypothetical protein